MNYKKLFTILVWAFVLFEIGNIFVLMDILDFFDVDPLAFSQPILFLFGQIVALVLLLRTDADATYIKKVKIISLLFILISPFLIIVFPTIYSMLTKFPSIMENGENFLSFALYQLLPSVIAIAVCVSYFTQLYSLDLLWSKSRKNVFGIISFLMTAIVGLIILVGTFFGVLDGGLS